MNTPVLPPDINHSEMDFSIESCEAKNGDCVSGIRFGLGAIKNVGEGPVQVILEARRPSTGSESGAFRTLDDFCRRVDLRQVNRRALESLIKAGAFDEFGHRAQLLAIVDRMLGLSTHAHRAADAGQMTLFGEAGPAAGTSVLAPLPNVEEAPAKEKLAWEKELVGIYTSEHPHTRVMADLHDTVTALCGQITEDMANQKVIVAGAITYVRRLTTKKGDPMAFAGLEDLQGTTEVVIFPRTWKQVEPIIQPDKIVVVRGKVDASGKQAKIIADSITDQLTITQAADGPRLKVRSLVASSMPQAAYAPQSALRTAEPQPVWDVEPNMPPQPDNVWPENMVPAKPIESARKVVSAPPKPNGNGSVAADRQSARSAAALTTAVQSPGYSTTNSIPRLLRITLARSGDHDKDVWLLSQAHQLLTRHEGHDRFVFRLTGAGNGPIEMDFPNHFTRYSPDLVGALEKMLGPGTVRVEMQG
jgi:DNA polymerase-3 subunit alpha